MKSSLFITLLLFLGLLTIELNAIHVRENENNDQETKTFETAKPAQMPIFRRRLNQSESSNQNLLNLLVMSSSQLAMTNYKDVQYYSSIQFGTPGQSLSVVLDTGSHLLWLPVVPDEEGNFFSLRMSKTSFISSNKLTSIQYGKGRVAGVMGYDIFTLPNSNIRVNHSLIFVNQMEDLEGMKSDGILGLSNLRSVDNFLDMAVKNKQISSPIYGFQLRNTVESTFFYDVPSVSLNNTFWIGATRDNYWTIPVIGFYVDGDYIKNCQEGVVDTGTSFLIANSDVYFSLYGKLPKRKCYTQGIYSTIVYCKYNPLVDVESFPKISIYTLGVKFVLNATDYLIPDPNGSEEYILGVAPANGLPFMIFGDVFMRKYLIYYDKPNNNVGFEGAIPIGKIPATVLYVSFGAWLFFIFSIFSSIPLFYAKKKSIFKDSGTMVGSSINNPLTSSMV